MEKKYEITDISKLVNGHTVYRIKALINFTLINGKEVYKGDIGGWIESENNLSQKGLCWVYEECMMYENSYRYDNSIGYGRSRQFGNSNQSGNSQQYGYTRV